jgi:hypothetical protein
LWIDGSYAAYCATNALASGRSDCNADTYCYPNAYAEAHANAHAETAGNLRDYYVRRAGYSTRGKRYVS